MKKLTVLLLAFAIVLSLCACAGGDANKETEPKLEGLCVGYSKQDITPDFEVGLGGYDNAQYRRFTGTVRSKIYLTCIAMTEGEETVLLFSQDILRCDAGPVNEARKRIKEATGIAEDHIMFCATHTHSAPTLTLNDAGSNKMLELYLDAAVTAAKEALADRASTTLYGAEQEVKGMNFVRNYLMPDGTLLDGNPASPTVANSMTYLTEVDDEMVVIKMDREGDKKDIMIMNWQAHPCFNDEGGNGTTISADFIGAARDKVEQAADMHFIYFTGAAGNQGTDTKITKDKHYLSMEDYGAKLGQTAIDMLATAEPIEGEGIKTKQEQFTYAYDHSQDHMLEKAKEVRALQQKNDMTGATELSKKYGFASVYESRAIISRASYPETGTMEFNTIYVAGMAFVHVPYEQFSNASIQIKGESPFKYTVMATCSNNGFSYIASAEAYDLKSYEGCTGFFARGCSEDAADKFVEMLKALQ